MAKSLKHILYEVKRMGIDNRKGPTKRVKKEKRKRAMQRQSKRNNRK